MNAQCCFEMCLMARLGARDIANRLQNSVRRLKD
jgi:hypothetical protein